MGRLIGNLTGHTYTKMVKPWLFKKHPDKVHDQTLKTAIRFQKYAPVRFLVRSSWAYQNEEVLSQTLNGITYRNPIGLSAGFDKNFEVPHMMKAVGFGFMEGGSMTFEPCPGNPRPWYHRLPNTKSLVVYAGLGNGGSEETINRLLEYPENTFKDFPLNISVAKTNSALAASEQEAIADYVGSLRRIKKAQVGNVVTLNISCPNTFGGEPFTTPERLENLLREVDDLELSQPIFIKMPCDLAWDDYALLLEVAARHNIAGLTISNLAKTREAVHPDDDISDAVPGNLSGKPVLDASNRLIKQTYQAYGDRFVISGVGGVFSAEDAYEKIQLGASVVQLVTGMIFQGPQLVGQINRGLVELLKADGFSHISQAVGSKTVKDRVL